jgi:hypothetical protein
MLTRSNTVGTSASSSVTTVPTTRFGSHLGYYRTGVYNEAVDTDHSNSSLNEEEALGDVDEDSETWGLAKGMALFEVSAKDDSGWSEFWKLLILADNVFLRCPTAV